MTNDSLIELEGTVIAATTNTKFMVKIKDSNHTLLAYLCGKIYKNKIKIMLGDTVTLEVNKNDLTQGRIKYRHGSRPRHNL
jgi:translation initiation factor IF-1